MRKYKKAKWPLQLSTQEYATTNYVLLHIKPYCSVTTVHEARVHFPGSLFTYVGVNNPCGRTHTCGGNRIMIFATLTTASKADVFGYVDYVLHCL